MTILLDANIHKTAPQHKRAPTHSFSAVSVNDMFTLGRDTTPFLEQLIETSRSLQRPARIGLIGDHNVGKTTWVRGLLAALRGYEIIEDSSLFRLQNVWHDAANNRGWIRHYDATVKSGPAGHTLESYIENDLSLYGFPLVDIAEHANRDLHDKKFDGLVYIERAHKLAGETRKVTYFVPPPYSDAQSYQDMVATLSRDYGTPKP